MATKRDILIDAARNEGVVGHAADDEPLFVLRASDLSAPGAIRAWATDARQRGVNFTKHASALAVADQMEAWVRKHGSKRPD